MVVASSLTSTGFIDPSLLKTLGPSRSPSPPTQPYWTLPSVFGHSSLQHSGAAPNLQESHSRRSDQSGFPHLDANKVAPGELQSIALGPVDKRERDSWSEATIINREFPSALRKLKLVHIAKYSSVL